MQNIVFIDNAAAKNNDERFMAVTIDVSRALESWRMSVFSFEWINADGRIKCLDELCDNERPKRTAIEEALKNGGPIEKPILGIGMEDNIEIGSGRAQFLTLADKGIKTMPVHIPKSNEKDFKDFIAALS